MLAAAETEGQMIRYYMMVTLAALWGSGSVDFGGPFLGKDER